ncbi:MAG: pyridoxamine 5'-phosphate oxidase family protein [Pseudomonadota bacterium]
MQSFADILFQGQVLAEQEREGTRLQFEAMYQDRLTGPLDADARAFIETRDSFYLATVSESGWPYVQHRGGPPGFLTVLGPEQLGFADYLGNRQLISKGHVAADARVSLFLMDYARQGRLKLLGHLLMTPASERPALAARVAVDGQGQVERVATIDLIAMDWNCPKYITPRYTKEEVATLVGPHLKRRDDAIATLSERLRALGEDPDDLIGDL